MRMVGEGEEDEEEFLFKIAIFKVKIFWEFFRDLGLNRYRYHNPLLMVIRKG